MRKILISIITLLLTISSYGQYQSTFVVDSTNQVFGETLSIGTKVRDLSTLKEWILNVKALSTDSLPSVSKSEIPTMPMDNEITSYEYYVDDSFTTDTLTTLTNKFKSLDSVMYWLFNDYLGNNYGGFNGDYDGDDTIEGISDVDFQNIEIGSVISAFGDVSVMRYNNFVLKKGSYGINNNWVTLSNNTIGAAVNDLLIFYNKTYIYVTGTQNVSSSIYLPNVTIVNRGKIIGNNLTLLNVSSTIPVMPYSFIDDGGEIYLKGNTSRLYYELTTSASNVFDHICNLNFGNVYSEGLDYAIFVDRYSSLYSHYKISCNINTLGKGIKADQIKSLSTRGHIEALLEGVNINQVSQLTQFLSISTPTSITAFMLLGGTSSVHNNADVYGTIIGNLYIDFDYSNINIYGSVMNSTINVYATRTNVNILGSIGSYGNNCAFNSIGASNTIYVNKFNGDFTQTGNSSVIFGANQRLLSQTISAGYVAAPASTKFRP